MPTCYSPWTRSRHHPPPARAHDDFLPGRRTHYGRREVGDFLRTILTPGASVDWRVLLRDAIGQDLSAEPMLRYFDPLLAWLRTQNRGRTPTLPEG